MTWIGFVMAGEQIALQNVQLLIKNNKEKQKWRKEVNEREDIRAWFSRRALARQKKKECFEDLEKYLPSAERILRIAAILLYMDFKPIKT